MSFLQKIQEKARLRPTQLAIRFLADGETESQLVTYGQLHQRSLAIAAKLQLTLEPHDRVLLLFNPGVDFIYAFLGCLYAGMVAVPAYPPRSHRKLDRLQKIAHDCRAKIILTTEDLNQLIPPPARAEAGIPAIKWLTVDTIPDKLASECILADTKDEDIAFLQYTSGSTGAPKGVMVTHGNIVANMRMIQQAMQTSEQGAFVSWLPVYHDMGLIGCVLHPLYVGCPTTLMPPIAFLEKPARWLKAISKYRATITGAPNFAFELCVRKINEDDTKDLDLSSLQVLFNGAEPVRANTLTRFSERFATHQLNPKSVFPCYGLAEATLFVAGGPFGGSFTSTDLSAAALANHQASSPSQTDDVVKSVSSGQVSSDQQVVIVDPQTCKRSGEGGVGEIWIQGPHVAKGYWQNTEKTNETFAARIKGEGLQTYLRTGDLGFFRNQQLHVTGREKDLIIIGGRNLYPQDIELVAEHSDPAIRPGGAAAFTVSGDQGERLIVLAEVERTAMKTDLPALAARLIAEISGEFEVGIAALVLLKPATLLKTTSGKIQRSANKKLYLENKLEELHRFSLEFRVEEKYTPPPPAPTPSVPETKTPLASVSFITPKISASPKVSPSVKQDLPLFEDLRPFIVACLAKILEVPESKISTSTPLAAMGMESVSAIELLQRIESHIGIKVPQSSIWDYPTIDALADFLQSEMIIAGKKSAS